MTVRSFDADLLRAEHERLFAPGNLVLSMAGNIMEGFWEVVAEAFDQSDWKVFPAAATGGVGDQPAAAMVDLDLDDIDPFRLDLISPIIQTYFEIGNLGIAFRAIRTGCRSTC